MMKNNWVSLLALLVSIIALMLSYRVIPIDFKDYWGFVLGVQSLLVALLIGWQILNVFEVRKQVEKFNDTIDKLKSENNRLIQDKISDYSKTVSALFQQNEGIQRYYNGDRVGGLSCLMNALKLLNNASDKTQVDGLIDFILALKKDDFSARPVNKKDIDTYLEIISNCNSEKKTELLKHVMSLPVN